MDDLERRTFASDTRELRPMSAWWRQWASCAGLAEETIDDGEVCLNEAVGNIIQHRRQHEAAIAITLVREAEAVRVTISDGLLAFNPLDYPAHDPPASVDEARVGGLGIHLIRTLAAEVHYRRDHGCNVLTLVFNCGRAR